jgi:WD40 repeat protein
MPESKNRMIAVGAADEKISFIDVERNETATVCSCHYRGVKTLAVSNKNPTLLWSGAEDCTVR